MFAQAGPELTALINLWRKEGAKIVFTNGCFDILHTGHIRYLMAAAGKGDKLIVGLNSDQSVKKLKGETRPVNKEEDRMLLMASLRFVDAVVLFSEDTPLNLVTFILPDLLVKGGDYTEDQVVGGDMVKQHGGQVEIIPFVDGYSTTATINRLSTLKRP